MCAENPRHFEGQSQSRWADVLPLTSSGCAQPKEPEPDSVAHPTKRGNVRLEVTLLSLPAIVRERLVRFRHPVRIFFLLDGVTLSLARRDHFAGQLFGHRLLVTTTGVADQPAHGQRGPAIRTDFDRHLVRGTTNATALDLDDRLEVVERLLEHRHTRLAGLGLDRYPSRLEDPLGVALLPLIIRTLMNLDTVWLS